MRKAILLPSVVMTCLLAGAPLSAQEKEDRALLPLPMMRMIVDESSGDRAMHTLMEIAPYPRDRKKAEYGSIFQESAYISSRAREAGLADVSVERFKIGQMGGPMGGRLWDGELGELWMVEPQAKKLLDYADVPAMLASNSESGDWTAELVDVGNGARDEEYAGKSISGRIVLGYAPAGTLQRMGIFQRGAVGVISYESMRPEYDPTQTLWGSITAQGLDGKKPGFGIKVAPRLGRELRTMLERGQKVKLRVLVKADFYDNVLETVFARIPGDGSTNQEVIVSAHLYEGYAKQGANDDASGSAALLEIGRTLSRLIADGKLPPPKRAIDLLWVPEISGTMRWLQEHPEVRKRLISDINMDMPGGWLSLSKAFFVLHRTPDTFPHYLNDVMSSLFDFVGNTNRERVRYRHNGYQFSYPIVSPNGSDDPFYYVIDKHYGASDHSIYLNGGIAATQMGTWPDMWYHSSGDTPNKNDPTQFKRAVVIAAAGAYTIASADDGGALRIAAEVAGRGDTRISEALRKGLSYMADCDAVQLVSAYKEALVAVRHQTSIERAALSSVGELMAAALSPEEKTRQLSGMDAAIAERGQAAARQASEFFKVQALRLKQPVVEPAPTGEEKRAAQLVAARVGGGGFGGFGGFGGNPQALQQLSTEERAALQKIPSHMTSELGVLLGRGRHTVLEIRDFLSGQFEPLPLSDLMAYIKAQEKMGAAKLTEKK